MYKNSIKELKETCIQKFNDELEIHLEYLEIVSLDNLHPIDMYNHNGCNKTVSRHLFPLYA